MREVRITDEKSQSRTVYVVSPGLTPDCIRINGIDSNSADHRVQMSLPEIIHEVQCAAQRDDTFWADVYQAACEVLDRPDLLLIFHLEQIAL